MSELVDMKMDIEELSFQERYVKIRNEFENYQQSYLYQCHLAFNPESLQYRKVFFERIRNELEELRANILSKKENVSCPKLYQTWSEKYICDITSTYYHYQQQKLPMGSGQVQPNLGNDRFLLSRITFLLSQVYFYNSYQMDKYLEYLKESYIWYPKSIQILFLLSEMMKVNANCSEKLQESEYFLRKGINLGSHLHELKQQEQNHNKDKEFEKWLEEELDAVEKSGQFLLLLLYQTNRSEEADQIIQLIPKYSWRINHQILNYYSKPIPSLRPIQPQPHQPHQHQPPHPIDPLEGLKKYIYYIEDNYLPSSLLLHLQNNFSNTSTFWLEHNYNHLNSQSMISGYFSYLYPFKLRKSVCSIEQLIDFLYQKLLISYPEIFQDAQLAEWWVHSRPHCCGHQLHYDSDESRIEAGGTPNHPVATVVLYLSQDEIGGPTMISDQLLNQSMGENTWLVHPKENRIVVFNAKYLHGVIPGVGPIPTGNIHDRRLTLMIGFWKALEATDKGLDHVGAGQPYPMTRTIEKDGGKTQFSWPMEFQSKVDWQVERNLDFTEIYSLPNYPLNHNNYHHLDGQSKWELESLEKYHIDYVQPFWIPLNEKPTSIEEYESFYQGF